jgi:hypothetical protein
VKLCDFGQPWIPKDKRSGLLMHTAIMAKRFVVRANEKLTAFTELESAIRGSLFATLANLSRKLVANVSFVIGDLPQSLASPNLLHLSA